MKRIVLAVFVFISVFVVTGTLAASDTQSFNLIFEKKPVVIIDFVDTNSHTTIDSLSFPMRTSENTNQALEAYATIRFQVAYASDIYIVCTRLADLSGYSSAMLDGSGTQAAMLWTDDETDPHRLNYSVIPTKMYTGTEGTTSYEDLTSRLDWEIDPSQWTLGTELDAENSYWRTASVLTKYRMAKIYTNNPAVFTGDQLIYQGLYTKDVFVDLTFRIDAIQEGEAGITDGVYTGYCHLVLEAK